MQELLQKLSFYLLRKHYKCKRKWQLDSPNFKSIRNWINNKTKVHVVSL